MSDAFIYSPPMNEELAIACVLYVAQKENLAPQEVLWGIVPIANRQTVCDGSAHEKAIKAERQGSQPNTENYSVPGYACR
jgi:hypothetical protein